HSSPPRPLRIGCGRGTASQGSVEGKRREYELLSLFRQSGRRIRRFTVGVSSELRGETLSVEELRRRYGVVPLAVKIVSSDSDGW
ncbi:MAG: hypothetical protein SV760_00605, partial [Halobacteria archaeon]|nr:hypothetical protein [Halobacteria archaeon]